MTKIKFKANVDTLEPLVEQYIEKGENFKALALLRRAPESVDTLLNIAEILGDMDFIAQSDQALYEVLKAESDNENANLMLAQNSFARGDISSAVYYASDEAFDMLNDMYQGEPVLIEPPIHEKYRIVYPKDKKYVDSAKDKAGEEFAKGNFNKAYSMYLDLLAISPNDIDLLNDTGFVCIMLNKPDHARKYVEAALDIDEHSIAALSNAVLLYDMLEMDAQRDFYSAKLDGIATDDLVKIFKTAAAFCECGDHIRAQKWLKKYLDERNNLEIMLLYAISCYNAKDYGKAKETLLQLLTVDPENKTVEFYLDYVNSKRGEKYCELDYTPQLPAKVIEDKIEILQKRADYIGMWSDRELYSEVDWAVNNVNGNKFIFETVNKIAATDRTKAKEYLLKLLLKSKFDSKAKKYIFKKAMELGAQGEISLVLNYKYYEIDLPEMPEKIAEPLREALSELAFEKVLSNEDVRKLYAVAWDLQTRLIDGGMTSLIGDKRLPALIARHASVEGVSDINICLLFGVEYNELIKINQTVYG